MSSIWSWWRPPKVDWNSTLHFGNLILYILISLGRLSFWQGKWDPNWKIQDVREIILDKISNDLSHAQFGYREGNQNWAWSGAARSGSGVARSGGGSKRSATSAALFLRKPIEEMVWIFGFKAMRTCTLESLKVFGAKLVHQKVKKHPQNDLSATFWTHRSSLGRIKFWGVKWASNSETLGVLEIILE